MSPSPVLRSTVRGECRGDTRGVRADAVRLRRHRAESQQRRLRRRCDGYRRELLPQLQRGARLPCAAQALPRQPQTRAPASQCGGSGGVFVARWRGATCTVRVLRVLPATIPTKTSAQTTDILSSAELLHAVTAWDPNDNMLMLNDCADCNPSLPTALGHKEPSPPHHRMPNEL
jgi:hypothetical protein